ncbi:DUF6343 family protein [Streptomyces sp. NPDC091377]|uniref:DUF6343 family protein n=1 Tax=Streptomyces sp. NPDC091377 TaxID=3365995 RepID=UPI0037F20730
MPMRTGNEPRTARSALRARLWLSVWGLIWAIFGTVLFVLTRHPGWAIACGVLWVVVVIDMTMIIRHIRQGPHYQPGPDVPPYEPLHDHTPHTVPHSRRPYEPPDRNHP